MYSDDSTKRQHVRNGGSVSSKKSSDFSLKFPRLSSDSILKLGIINLRKYGSKSNDIVVLIDSEVAFFGERVNPAFRLFLYNI